MSSTVPQPSLADCPFPGVNEDPQQRTPPGIAFMLQKLVAEVQTLNANLKYLKPADGTNSGQAVQDAPTGLQQASEETPVNNETNVRKSPDLQPSPQSLVFFNKSWLCSNVSRPRSFCSLCFRISRLRFVPVPAG
ncbi:hypothetical protein N658DRAFT_160028 [Parathielavia hyrcaniae]|uniref:Uncharacterized protein n=1 Tax=Parathielavia hyrcaniae TaxID=113614 RepID=A0AAN6T098_9PEZI|nr:hypothetical protein N658DRAFT_160028 [Parathielavia hyrcaniae]